MPRTACLPPRMPPPKLTAPRNTSKVVNRDGPGHAALPPWRSWTPPRKEPAHYNPLEGRSRRCHSSARGSPRSVLQRSRSNRPGHGSISSEPARTLPATGSPPSFYGGEELGEGENSSLPSSSHPRILATRRSSDGEQERRRGGWQHRVARVPPESSKRGDTGARKNDQSYSFRLI
jgi:hypothetical protein